MSVSGGLKSILLPLSVFNHRFTLVARNLAAVLLACMTAIILSQVFWRYILNDSLSWSEEVSKLMMVWSAFLVAPWAYRQGANVSIDMFVEAFPRRLRQILELLLNLLVLFIVVVYFRVSLEFWERGLNSVAATLPMRMAWFYTVVPLGFGGLFVVGCELLIRKLLALLQPGEDFSVPGAGTREVDI